MSDAHLGGGDLQAGREQEGLPVGTFVELAVGQALDRVNKDGFQLSSTLGRHTNDKMVSFYVRAPGGWEEPASLADA